MEQLLIQLTEQLMGLDAHNVQIDYFAFFQFEWHNFTTQQFA